MGADRQALVEQLGLAMQRYERGAQVVRRCRRVADSGSTRPTCAALDWLADGPKTAGQLAEATGLRPAATTTLIDRLSESRAGTPRRERDRPAARVLVEDRPTRGFDARPRGVLRPDVSSPRATTCWQACSHDAAGADARAPRARDPGADRPAPRPGCNPARSDQRLPVTAADGPASSSTLNAGLVEDRDAEALGLVGLGAGVVADDDVVGLLRHRRRALPPRARIASLAPSRREVDERAGDHEGQALEGALGGLVALVRHRYAGARATCRRSRCASRRPRRRTTARTDSAMVGPDALGGGERPRSDAVRDRAAIEPNSVGQRPGRGRPDVPDRQPDQHPPQRHAAWPASRLASSRSPLAESTRPSTSPSASVFFGRPGEQVGLQQLVRGRGRTRRPRWRSPPPSSRAYAASEPRPSMSKDPRARDVEDPVEQLRPAELVVGAAEVLVALLLLHQRGAAGRALGRHHPLPQALRAAGRAPARRSRGSRRRPCAARRCRRGGRPCGPPRGRCAASPARPSSRRPASAPSPRTASPGRCGRC